MKFYHILVNVSEMSKTPEIYSRIQINIMYTYRSNILLMIKLVGPDMIDLDFLQVARTFSQMKLQRQVKIYNNTKV